MTEKKRVQRLESAIEEVLKILSQSGTHWLTGQYYTTTVNGIRKILEQALEADE